MTEGPAWAPRHARRSALQSVAIAVRAFLLDPPEAAVPHPVAGSAEVELVDERQEQHQDRQVEGVLGEADPRDKAVRVGP